MWNTKIQIQGFFTILVNGVYYDNNTKGDVYYNLKSVTLENFSFTKEIIYCNTVDNMKELTTAQKIEQITAEWIIQMMQDFKIKNPRQLSILANVRYESLNLALNKKRVISSEIKNSLYWYFRFLNAERQIQDFNRI